jgi:hypothetical protein
MDTPLPNFDLDTRAGWPAALRFLLDQYPREVWAAHVNLGDTAKFWLQIHQGFRDIGGGLEAKATEFREGLIKPDEFRRWLAPRLQTLLTHLDGHHRIEDFHFFPVFSAAEPRLATGFEVLERDHGAIHQAMDETVDRANALLAASATDDDAMRRAADAYAQSHDPLLRRLNRHLLDEEDLIIPLILERTEGKLGM